MSSMPFRRFPPSSCMFARNAQSSCDSCGIQHTHARVSCDQQCSSGHIPAMQGKAPILTAHAKRLPLDLLDPLTRMTVQQTHSALCMSAPGVAMLQGHKLSSTYCSMFHCHLKGLLPPCQPSTPCMCGLDPGPQWLVECQDESAQSILGQLWQS